MARDTSLDDSAQNSELETGVDKVDPNTPNLERQVLAQSTCGQLWEKVRGHCDGELDLIVLRLIVEDLKPGQLYSENRDKFNDISEIHQRRQNLVDRLKRNGEILQLLEDCTDVRPQDRLRRTRRKKS